MPNQRSALVIMNQQIGFMNEATEFVPDRICELLDTVSFAQVFFTQFIHRPDLDSHAQLLGGGMTYDDPESGLVPQFLGCAKGRTYRTAWLGFPRSLLFHLRGASIDTLYLAGVETDHTILKSVLDLLETPYRPVVLADYCASCGGADPHGNALALLRRHIGADQVHHGRFTAPHQTA